MSKLSRGDLVEVVQTKYLDTPTHWVGARGYVEEIGPIKWPLEASFIKVKLNGRAGLVELRVWMVRVLTVLDLLAEI